MRNATWWIRRRVAIVPRVGATEFFYRVRDRGINKKHLKMKEKTALRCREWASNRRAASDARARSVQLSTSLHNLHTCG